MVFWWLLQQGLLPKDQAVQMLKQAVKANKAGGEDHQLAATKLPPSVVCQVLPVAG